MSCTVKPYVRQVNYYETDQMAVVHHSNYIRYMEEARLDYMRQLGLDYAELEALGIIIPVVDVSGHYLISLRFGDSLRVETTLTLFNGIRAIYHYEMFRQGDGKKVFCGESSHCFLDNDTRRLVSLKKREPAIYKKWMSLLPKQAEGEGDEL